MSSRGRVQFNKTRPPMSIFVTSSTLELKYIIPGPCDSSPSPHILFHPFFPDYISHDPFHTTLQICKHTCSQSHGLVLSLILACFCRLVHFGILSPGVVFCLALFITNPSLKNVLNASLTVQGFKNFLWKCIQYFTQIFVHYYSEEHFGTSLLCLSNFCISVCFLVEY